MRLTRRLVFNIVVRSLVCMIFYMLGSLVSRNENCSAYIQESIQPEHRIYPELVNAGFGNQLLKHHSTLLVVLILSSVGNYERRKVIRETWLADEIGRDLYKHYFVVGAEDLPEETRLRLAEEKAEFKDVLALPMLDTYGQLTEKLLNSLVHLDRNIDFDYLLKVDDDTYVDLGKVIGELREANFKTGLYWGFFDGRAPVQKSGKWAEPDYVLCDRYIPYALGGGYVLSYDLVSYISQNSEVLQRFNSEDVSVGTWLAGLKLHRIHDERFDTEFKSRGCSNSFIVTHKQNADDMRAKFASVTATRTLCGDNERSDRLSYKYNWSALPSKCCKRE